MNETMAEAGEDPKGRCELLGSFALFVQGALGALALLVLLWKRAREHPQRPMLIWFMDVSKQVLGSVLVHAANLLLSMISSGTLTTEPSPSTIVRHIRRVDGEEDDGEYHSNPCSFYLLNLGIDTTVGVVILIYSLRILHKLVERCPVPGLRTGVVSGYYGEPPRWSYWAKQATIYFAGLMIMKLVVAVMFAICPWLGRVGDFLLGWTEGNKQLQVFFVMFFFPLVMNAFQYYVIDSFIKHKDPSQDVLIDAAPIDDEPDLHHPRHSFNYRVDDSDSDDAEGSKRLLQPDPIPRRGSRDKKPPNYGVEEYNPDFDGTNSIHQGSPQSGYFKGSRGGMKRPPTVASTKSRNSSMMLLPGSRGPSTPGYNDGESIGRRESPMRDDDSTLVDGENK